jgi:hypothetical protein
LCHSLTASTILRSQKAPAGGATRKQNDTSACQQFTCPTAFCSVSGQFGIPTYG